MTREAAPMPGTIGELELLSHHCQHLRLTRIVTEHSDAATKEHFKCGHVVGG
jgi:hypothetical protein